MKWWDYINPDISSLYVFTQHLNYGKNYRSFTVTIYNTLLVWRMVVYLTGVYIRYILLTDNSKNDCFKSNKEFLKI